MPETEWQGKLERCRDIGTDVYSLRFLERGKSLRWFWFNLLITPPPTVFTGVPFSEATSQSHGVRSGASSGVWDAGLFPLMPFGLHPVPSRRALCYFWYSVILPHGPSSLFMSCFSSKMINVLRAGTVCLFCFPQTHRPVPQTCRRSNISDFHVPVRRAIQLCFLGSSNSWPWGLWADYLDNYWIPVGLPVELSRRTQVLALRPGLQPCRCLWSWAPEKPDAALQGGDLSAKFPRVPSGGAQVTASTPHLGGLQL